MRYLAEDIPSRSPCLNAASSTYGMPSHRQMHDDCALLREIRKIPLIFVQQETNDPIPMGIGDLKSVLLNSSSISSRLIGARSMYRAGSLGSSGFVVRRCMIFTCGFLDKFRVCRLIKPLVRPCIA